MYTSIYQLISRNEPGFEVKNVKCIYTYSGINTDFSFFGRAVILNMGNELDVSNYLSLIRTMFETSNGHPLLSSIQIVTNKYKYEINLTRNFSFIFKDIELSSKNEVHEMEQRNQIMRGMHYV